MAFVPTKDLTMNRTNAIRNLSLSLLLAATAFAAPAYAQVSFNISIAPPAPQYEVVPVISPGYVWAPGYWGWNGERHIWVRGRSIVQRVGYRWEPDRWEQRNRTYYRTAGHWQHDNDFRPVKMKKEKKHKDHDNNGRRGRGGKHDD
jgi:YXWGXW repeat-containing protein